MSKLVSFVFLVFFFAACGDQCEELEVRCSGNVVEICSDEQNWEVITDCDTVEPAELDWTCCYSADVQGLTCLPKESCDGGIE